MVDDEDYNFLSRWKWCFADGYAARGGRKEDGLAKRRNISMHKVIKPSPKGMQVDHINGDTLDNRRGNLRVVTHGQNQMNKVKKPRFCKERNKWEVRIRSLDGKRTQKRYSTYSDAIAAIQHLTPKLQGIEARV